MFTNGICKILKPSRNAKLDGQVKVGKATFWEGRRQGLGTVPGNVARKFMSEVTVYLENRCREKTCPLFLRPLSRSSQFGKCCLDVLPVTSCSATETTRWRFSWMNGVFNTSTAVWASNCLQMDSKLLTALIFFFSLRISRNLRSGVQKS